MPKKLNQREILKKLDTLRDKLRSGDELTPKQSDEFDNLIEKLYKQQPDYPPDREYINRKLLLGRVITSNNAMNSLIHAIGMIAHERLELLTPQERALYIVDTDDWIPAQENDHQNEIIIEQLFDEISIEIYGFNVY